jgi:7-dehydrocholesterol reductase
MPHKTLSMTSKNEVQYSSSSFVRTLTAIFLIVLTPPIVFILWYTNHYLNGSFIALFRFFAEEGFFNGMIEIIAPVMWGSKTAWTIIGIFIIVQLAFMKLLPGKLVKGPKTPNGFTPEYKNNGFLAFITTLFAFWLLGFQLKVFPPSILYDHLGEILGALNIFALLFCLLLYFKGIYKPSTPDSGSSGNPIFDYYWGTDLYPIYRWF